MILSLVLSALAAVLNAGTVIVFFKPDRLRFAELPALFWVALAGRESRARMGRILASRERAAHEAVRAGVAQADGLMAALREQRDRREALQRTSARPAQVWQPPKCPVCKQRGCGLFHWAL